MWRLKELLIEFKEILVRLRIPKPVEISPQVVSIEGVMNLFSLLNGFEKNLDKNEIVIKKLYLK